MRNTHSICIGNTYFSKYKHVYENLKLLCKYFILEVFEVILLFCFIAHAIQ